MLRDGKGFSNPITLASAATTDIGGQNSHFVEISGTTTITSLGSTYNGPRFLRFTGVLTLTYNATTLNIPGAANIVTTAGDVCVAIPNAAQNGWNISNYTRASGLVAGVAPRATRIDVASVAGTVDLTANAPNTDDIRITGALVITGFTVATDRVLRVTAGGAFTLTNGAGLVTQTGANIVAAAGDTFMLRATAANTVEVLNYVVSALVGQVSQPAVTVRQTVISGPVDTNGFPTFLPATSVNLNLTTQNISTGVNALVATAAGGANASGAINVVGQATANLTWTGLTANNTNYLPVAIASSGMTALPPVTLALIVQRGGTPSTTNGQYTYITTQGVTYLGNGSTASAVNHVIVGEAVAGASTITSTVAYAYQRSYVSALTATLPAGATTLSVNANLGTNHRVAVQIEFQCTTAELGYSIGDVVDSLSVSGSAYAFLFPWVKARNTISSIIANGGWVIPNKSTGVASTITPANWSYRVSAKGDW